MRASLYNNPMFASGLSSVLQGFLGNPMEAAKSELYASEAGLNNDTRRYREAIGTAGGKQDLAGLLVSALQGGMGGAAPGVASSLASLPEFGLDKATQGTIQVGTGTQAAGGTFMGLDQVLGNALTLQGNEFAHKDRLAAEGNKAFQSALGGLLIDSESGGNWGAQNNEVGSGGQVGHFGRGQFGIERLADAKAAGVIPPSVSPEVFMRNPDMQMRVEQWHRGDIISQAQANGTYNLIGQSIMGIPVTEQGLVNVAHLGGAEGARKFFLSGGEFNPADANGTRLSDYLAKGAQESGGGGQQSIISPEILALLMNAGNPSMTGPQSSILMGLVGMLSGGGDPFTLAPGQQRFDAAGNLIAGAPEEDPALSSGGRSTIVGALGEDVDPATALKIAEQIEQIMRDNPDMTETAAMSYALSNLETEETVVDPNDGWNPMDWFRGPETETKLKGVKATSPVEGIGQPGAVARPNSKAEMDALPSGTTFIAPDGSRRIKP